MYGPPHKGGHQIQNLLLYLNSVYILDEIWNVSKIWFELGRPQVNK